MKFRMIMQLRMKPSMMSRMRMKPRVQMRLTLSMENRNLRMTGVACMSSSRKHCMAHCRLH